MKKIYNIIISATVLIPMLLSTACGGSKDDEEKAAEKKAEELTRFDHIDKIVNQYGDMLLSTPVDGMEMERLLMDINSRCQMLMEQGDTLKAFYFHHAIEQNVRNRDSILADRIFGECPYTAFAINRE